MLISHIFPTIAEKVMIHTSALMKKLRGKTPGTEYYLRSSRRVITDRERAFKKYNVKILGFDGPLGLDTPLYDIIFIVSL